MFGHNILDYYQLPTDGMAGALSKIFLSALGSFIPLSANRAIVVLYAFLPWAGALLLGYLFGSVYKTGFDAKKRKQILLLAGITMLVLFVGLRLVNRYGDISHWSVQRNGMYTFLSFLNTSKQTPSLLFFLMTLGPLMLLLAFAEKANNWFSSVCAIFGNVPYFYFIVHLSLLRILNLGLVVLTGIPLKFPPGALVWQAEGFGYPL